ncbi:DUF2272 domain-containing protein [Acidiphilium acidophilum]|uniref:DUF2272 domain-containing protein n=1 Tax=Acidiphilium acidophilum TaxID=76588 RepID=A0AAW9DQZ6_ACIAO|nr:DUF2272 domain-containing protein [Acidiphilium acidophilum]MDX5931326.1 DUF2272 domain-containing protein [Acidiphilium acidophilum]
MKETIRKYLAGTGVLLALSGCAVRPDAHAPPFANRPYEAFSRIAAIQIARGEWRYWGSRVVDTPPSAYHPVDAQAKQERDNGDWQEVGLYWWIGMNAGHYYDRWTGKHGAAGRKFSPRDDGHFAWSAAFISYVMRMAGAGPDFPYSPNHAKYIDYAWNAAHGKISDPLLLAENPVTYAPVPGDLICAGRGSADSMTYANLPSRGFFPSHCAIVVRQRRSMLSVIGGNVDDTVALTHVPTTTRDTLEHRDGTIVDPRYDWFVALKVLYRR